MEGELPETPVLKEPQGHPAEWFPAQEVELDNGKLDIRDIRPEALREDKDVPLVSILGFGTGNAALSRTFMHLRDSGEHILGIDFVGGGKGIEGGEGASTEFNRQGELLYQYLNDYLKSHPEIEQVDFMTQSAGLLKVFALAKLHPEFLPKIRNLIMYSPVGIYEKDDFLGPVRIGKRFLAEDKRYKDSPYKSQFDRENTESLKKANERLMNLKNPKEILRHLKIVNSLARGASYPTLEVLKAAGIKIGVIQGDSDKLASAEMLFKRMGEGYESPFIKSSETPSEYQWVEKDQKEPPIDVVRLVGGGFYKWENEEERKGMVEIPGGHGIQVDSPESASKDIMQTKDYLNSI
jgi:hypothetical protein